MLIKILGLLDIITGITIVGYYMNIMPDNIVMFVLIYIGVKFLVFAKDFASFVDLACAILLLLMMAGFRPAIALIASFYFLQKGVLSIR